MCRIGCKIKVCCWFSCRDRREKRQHQGGLAMAKRRKTTGDRLAGVVLLILVPLLTGLLAYWLIVHVWQPYMLKP